MSLAFLLQVYGLATFATSEPSKHYMFDRQGVASPPPPTMRSGSSSVIVLHVTEGTELRNQLTDTDERVHGFITCYSESGLLKNVH